MTTSIYVIEANDSFFIQTKLEEIRKRHHLESVMVSEYDLLDGSLDAVMEDLDTYSLFSEKKWIVVWNASFLSSDALKKEEDAVLHLMKYLDQPNPDHIVVFLTSKLDTRKKVVKQLQKCAQIIEMDVDVSSFAKSQFAEYEIDDAALTLLLELVRYDMGKVYQEANKLKLYCLETKRITKDDVSLLVSKTIDDSDTYYFAFIQTIVSKNKKKALSIYRELLSLNVEPLKILITLANQFRLIYQVKVLSEEHYRNEEIAKMLDSHPYRVQKTKDMIYDYSKEDLIHYLQALSQIDVKIKKGDIDSKSAIELFILGMN